MNELFVFIFSPELFFLPVTEPEIDRIECYIFSVPFVTLKTLGNISLETLV